VGQRDAKEKAADRARKRHWLAGAAPWEVSRFPIRALMNR
jgi:hypothetical protein